MSVSQPQNQPQSFSFEQNSTTSFELNSSIMNKRKDFDLEVHFPPQKSRRLDCDLYGTSMTMTMEEDPNLILKQSNQERAVVLYEPSSNVPLVRSPTSPPFTIVINTDFIPSLKDYLLSRGTSKLDELGKDEARREKSSEVSKDCLAVIPWIPSHSPMACEEIAPPVTAKPSELEAQEEAEMMEMDEPHINDTYEKAVEMADLEESGASTPWQQHCVMPNMLLKTTTPMRWC